MKKALLFAIVLAALCAPLNAAPTRDAFGYYVFDMGVLKPLTAGIPGTFCIDVATKLVVDTAGNKIKDPVTGCQATELDWTNSNFMWRKIVGAYFVQSVTLEKIHTMRKGACSLIWKNDYIRQQGKEKGKINLCWPLLYETEGTKFVLSIVYQTNPAVPDAGGRSARVHKERYVWTVDWKAANFSEFRQRLMYFARFPAGQCELFAVPPLELRSILWVLDAYGCVDFQTYDPGITALMANPTPENLQLAQNKAGLLEQILDSDSCIDPCAYGQGLPIPGAIGIVNSDQVPAGSVLLTDFYYAANAAGLLQD